MKRLSSKGHGSLERHVSAAWGWEEPQQRGPALRPPPGSGSFAVHRGLRLPAFRAFTTNRYRSRPSAPSPAVRPDWEGTRLLPTGSPPPGPQALPAGPPLPCACRPAHTCLRALAQLRAALTTVLACRCHLSPHSHCAGSVSAWPLLPSPGTHQPAHRPLPPEGSSGPALLTAESTAPARGPSMQ